MKNLNKKYKKGRRYKNKKRKKYISRVFIFYPKIQNYSL